MFAKLSALAIFLPFISALSITCPTQVKIGATTAVDCVTSASDPSAAAFILLGPHLFAALNVDVILNTTVTLNIPGDIPAGPGYVIVATKANDLNVRLAETASFECID